MNADRCPACPDSRPADECPHDDVAAATIARFMAGPGPRDRRLNGVTTATNYDGANTHGQLKSRLRKRKGGR